MFEETPNHKGERIGKFAAEMAQLAKRPEMRPFLTITEAKRQEKENEAEQKKHEEECLRRDQITAQWFELNMKNLAPELWAKFQETKDPDILAEAGWQLDCEMTVDEREGFEPTPVTLCSIMKVERIYWEEPKPNKSKLITQ